MEKFRSMSSSPGKAATHFDALDGWRGICACFVVLLHFRGYSPIYDSALVRNAYLFVDFFFVLSGFVIAWNYAARLDSREAVRRFLVLRFGRLYPLHIFMLFCFLAYETARLLAPGSPSASPPFTGGTEPLAVLSNVFLLHSLHLHDNLTWNSPSWSISTEFWTYVVYALVSAWLGLRKWMLWAAAIVLPLLLWRLSTTAMDITYDWGLLRCLFGFAVGVACCQIYTQRLQRTQPSGPGLMTLVEVAVVIAVVMFVSLTGKNNGSLLAPFLFGLAVLVFAPEAGWVSRLLRSAPARWLGRHSYSIYLTHLLVVLLVPRIVKLVVNQDLWTSMPLADGTQAMVFGRNDLEGTLGYVLVMVLTLAFSAFTYRWIETPGRDWSRLWARRPQARTDGIAAT